MERYERKFKKSLRESSGYYKASMLVDVYEDSYKEGEGQHVNSWESKIKANDLNSLLKKVANEVGANRITDLEYGNLNDYDWGSEIWYSIMVDEDNYPVKPNSPDFKMWKQGDKILYSQRWHIIVSRIGESPIPEQEFKKLGLSSHY